MPARQFFAVYTEAKKQSAKKEAANFVALCDIQSIALGNSKYYNQIRRVFLNRALGRQEFIGKRKSLDPTDPETVRLIAAGFRAAKNLRVNHGEH